MGVALLPLVHASTAPLLQLESPSSDLWELKAIDFGSSTFIRDGEQLSHVVGSPHYVAPEVLM